METLSVLGAGSWGTSIANLLSDNGHRVQLWCFEKNTAEEIALQRENSVYLPGIKISQNVIPTASIEEACRNSKTIISVVPSQHTRKIMSEAEKYINDGCMIVSASKGIEKDTYLTMSQVFSEVFHGRNDLNTVTLGGPTFATEVARKLPTVMVFASKNESAARYFQNIFSNQYFRAYVNDDVIGVELGGAIKNIIAIAAGIVTGLGCGHNTVAALITRGIAEISRLGISMGAKLLTFAGLAGMGDLILTCTGDLSRNRQVGLKIAEGKKLQEILGGMKMVAEGVETAISVEGLAKKQNVEMPICHEVYTVLFNNKDPRVAIRDLMERNLKKEFQEGIM
ncbi:MAG: NAD(P)-dependent glycerol-3-phosphate dehydrogenase [Candidatus Schekmanbacteria bacterium]|nr:NAD(P)-dependent glycerol-3-phosphate dehydrogenase [Candidatus Schekmanbacteria bacterium]